MTTRLMSWPAAADAAANADARRQNLPMEAIGLLGATTDQDGTAAQVDADVAGQ